MRQIYDAPNKGSYVQSDTNGVTEDAAFAFCLGDVTVTVCLSNGTKIRGHIRGFSCLDHKRREGFIELFGPDARVQRHFFRDIDMIDLPNIW